VQAGSLKISTTFAAADWTAISLNVHGREHLEKRRFLGLSSQLPQKVLEVIIGVNRRKKGSKEAV